MSGQPVTRAPAATGPSTLYTFRGTERFELVTPLGQGGGGVVFEAYDRNNDCLVALKLLPSLSPTAATRFKNEFRAAQGIHHTNLVSLRELFDDNGRLFLTMELVRGQDIIEFVYGQQPRERHQPSVAVAGEATLRVGSPAAVGLVSGPRPVFSNGPDYERLRSSFAQLACALQALHVHGKLHRDVKPSNVLVTDTGRTVLLDFGLIVDTQRRLAKHEFGLGTVSYMSPEQAAGAPLSAASDWYCVGTMLYQALSGRLPFAGQADDVLRIKQAESAPPLPACTSHPDDLVHLCERLLQRDPAARPTVSEIFAVLTRDRQHNLPRLASPTAHRPSFVGRKRELQQLADALALAEHGPTVVSIEGESGVGKSALSQEFLARSLAADRSLVVFRGRCSERELLPFKAFDAVVEDIVTQFEGDVCLSDAVERSALLAAVEAASLAFPVLSRLARSTSVLRTQTPRDAHAKRHLAFCGVRDLLHALSARLRVVVYIDDWQWVDADSIALLSAILSPPSPPPFLLLITARSESTTLALAPHRMTRIRLGNLTVDDARELATQLLERGNSDGSLLSAAQAVAVESTGHPLFIAELVRQVSAPGRVPHALPRLDDALWARFAALEPLLREAVEILATAGAPLALSHLRDALHLLRGSLSGVDLLQAVARLRDENFVRSDGLSGTDLIDCFHDRLASAVLAPLPEAERAGRHRVLALVFEQNLPDDLEALTLHWRAAGESARAARYAFAAGDRAMAALAFERAVEFYRLSSELAQRDSALVHERLGEVLSHLGRGRAAADAYLVGAQLSADDRRADLLRLAADQLFRSGYVDNAVALIERLFVDQGLSLPQSPRQALLWLAGLRVRVRWRGTRFQPATAEAIGPRRLAHVDTLWSVAIGLSTVDNLRGAYIQSRHLLTALKLGEPFRVLRALAAEAGYRAALGVAARDDVQRLLLQADELARMVEDPYAFGFVHLARGIAAFLHGDWAAARSACDQAVSIFERRPVMASWELASARMFSLWAAFYSGDFELTRNQVPLLIREAESRGDLYAATCLGLSLCNAAWLIIDRPSEARRHLTQADERWSNTGIHLQHYWSTVAWVNLELYEGNAQAAYDHIVRIRPLLKQALLLRIELVRVEQTWLWGRAALAVAEGHPEQRAAMIAIAETCAARLAREKLAWAPAAAALIRAGALALRGKRELALQQLGPALELAERSNMQPLVFAIRHLLRSDQYAAWSHGVAPSVVVRPERWTALFAPGFDAGVRLLAAKAQAG